MNLRTTVFFLLLTIAGGVAWWKWDEVSSHRPSESQRSAVSTSSSGSRLLPPQLRDDLRKIDISHARGTLTLERDQAGRWALPGNWPIRQAEAQSLVDMLVGLESRFAPIPVEAGSTDLKPFGLDPSQQPVSVILHAKTTYHLLFGEPDLATSGPFARPTYVLINDRPEVFRLGPDLLTVLRRPREFYQRRQLFPDAYRVRFAENRSLTPVSPASEIGSGSALIPQAEQIVLQGPQGRIVIRSLGPIADQADPRVASNLTHELLAEKWEIVEPVNDRADPDALHKILTAIPQLWVESFAPMIIPKLLAIWGNIWPMSPWTTSLLAAATLGDVGENAVTAQLVGLNPPEYQISVTWPRGDTTTLQIGRVSRVSERPGTPPPARPGMPPLPPLPVREEFRYARLTGQPVVFEVKADKLTDLFPNVSSLRDAKLARFQSADVREITIQKGNEKIVLRREKDASSSSGKWRIVQPIQAIAEDAKVTELIDKFVGLEARDADVLDQIDAKAAGLDAPVVQVTLSLEEELPAQATGATKEKRNRTISFAFGSTDQESKKVHVKVADRKRVNRVDDSSLTLASRSALAYRGRRIWDFETRQVARIDIQRSTETFTLQQEQSEWSLTEPVKAPVERFKASDLASDLGRLEAVEYVNDQPTPQQLADYGLDKPTLTIRVNLVDSATPAQVLLIGKQKDGSTDYYAKLADGQSVFLIRKDLRDRLDHDSLSFRVKQLWTLGSEDINALTLEHGSERVELRKDGGIWRMTQPLEAPASVTEVQPVLDTLAALRVEGYETHKATKLEDFGLQPPQLKLTFIAKEKQGEMPPTSRTRSLLLGKAVSGKAEIYAKLDGDDAVFRVSDALSKNGTKPPYDWLDRRIFTIDRDRISSLERGGASTWVVRRDGEQWKVTAGPLRFPADQPILDSTLKVLESFQAQKIVAYGKTANLESFGLQMPADTLKIEVGGESSGGSSKSHILRFGKAAEGGGRYLTVDDQPAVYVIDTTTIRELLRGALDFADKTLLKLDNSSIKRIQRVMANNDLELVRSNGWRITKPSEMAADENVLEELVKRLSVWRADRVAAYQPSDLKPFGLDVPAATLTLDIEANGQTTQKTIKVGSPANAAQPDGERYVLVDSSPIVGIVDGLMAKRLLAGAIAFRDRLLVRRLPEPDKITLRKGDRKVTFARLQGTWRMTEPLVTDAEHSDIEDFTNMLYRLRADELVAEKPSAQQLAEYGLDQPSWTWQFFRGDSEVLKLSLGKKDSTDQRRYAILGNGEIVFLPTPAMTAKATSEYRKRSILPSFDSAQAESLTLATESGETVLRKKDGSWQIDGQSEGKVRQDAVNDMLAALANLKAHEFVVDKGAKKELFGLAPPKRRIVARTSTGQTAEIHLGNRQGGTQRVYASLPDRDEVFTLSDRDSEKLFAEVK